MSENKELFNIEIMDIVYSSPGYLYIPRSDSETFAGEDSLTQEKTKLSETSSSRTSGEAEPGTFDNCIIRSCSVEDFNFITWNVFYASLFAISETAYQ